MQQQHIAAHVGRVSSLRSRSALFRWLLACIFLLTFAPVPQPAQASPYPQLWLPQPIGEPWKIIQGYGCGTHNAFDFYALDLVQANGPIYGAPVRAAADGRVFGWFGSSGTLILKHSDTFYTQYTHMATVATSAPGQFVPQGAVVGTVGDRGSPGIPHLHFMAFTATGPYASNRQTIPLSFADGYDLPNIGGCNQHYGKILTAKAPADLEPPAIHFTGEVEPGKWYNEDKRIDFNITGAVQGFSQRWKEDPGGEAPMFAQADEGYVQLAWSDVEGMHTLYVRIWSVTGEQMLETYGPIGYDITPPQLPTSITPLSVAPGTPAKVSWQAAQDSGSGVAGYRVYIGTDANGESEWYTTEPQVEVPALAPGTYNLRIQALDEAGNVSDWQTVGAIVSEASDDKFSENTPTPTRTAEPEATAAPEPTLTPTRTAEPEPTNEPEPEPTLTPTNTPEPEQTTAPEPTAEPTSTPQPTAEPTSTPQPTAEPSPSPAATDEPATEPVKGLPPEKPAAGGDADGNVDEEVAPSPSPTATQPSPTEEAPRHADKT